MAEIQQVRPSSGICSPVVLPVASSCSGSPVVPPLGPTEAVLGGRRARRRLGSAACGGQGGSLNRMLVYRPLVRR